jgi:peroxiredoxin
MKKSVLFIFLLSLFGVMSFAQGYQIGDKAADFKLKSVDGSYVSLSDYPDAKGFVVVFTCNTCPYAKAYEDRIIALDKKYAPLGYPVIAINPNDPSIVSGDSFDAMKERAREKNYPFPYLKDAFQEVYKEYGATRTPHFFVLKKDGNALIVKYIGTVDDNYKDPSMVQHTYLADAIDALIAGNNPDPATTKAIGCSIKSK